MHAGKLKGEATMGSNTADKALRLLRYLPRVCLANIRDNPGAVKKNRRGRAQHGGDNHGDGNKGSGQRQNYMRLGHHLRRQYPPLSLNDLQLLIETNRINANQPIDLVSILNSGLYRLSPDKHEFGIHLTDEGADLFKAKVNIEVQWASELVIAAIEKAGGTITTSYYDQHSLQAMLNTKKFFERGVPIPRRMIPPADAIEYYTDPTKRGYLSDPEKISEERFVLSQKYGYTLPNIEEDKDYEMLTERKDPRQIFFGLNPGWVVNLKDKVILKPQNEDLKDFYST
ncbi:hypothetical protein WA026_003116 [Henosepilachna vigintioctopunctata]|uniref:Large ribosomal subunit protein uL15m n=1 Tax=Henosepilachna vigintioctopunctata TaxID=420089 RepID=A0AAW1THZ1_9CUCU